MGNLSHWLLDSEGDFRVGSWHPWSAFLNLSILVLLGRIVRISWCGNRPRKPFFVKSYYLWICLGDLISFTSKEICAWATCSKVMFLCVGGYRMKIFTIDLMIRGCSLMNICWMCELKEETTNHIFIHFEWASRLWYLLFFLFFVRWVLLNGVNKLLLGSSS